MSQMKPFKSPLTFKNIFLGFLGFISLPILLVICLLTGAYLNVTSVDYEYHSLHFRSTDVPEDLAVPSHVEFANSAQTRHIVPVMGPGVAITDAQWRYGGETRSTKEVLDDLRRRSTHDADLRVDVVMMTCFNAEDYNGVNAEIWINAAVTEKEDFNGLSDEDLELSKQALPSPDVPTGRDYRVCGAMAAQINDIIDSARMDREE